MNITGEVLDPWTARNGYNDIGAYNLGARLGRGNFFGVMDPRVFPADNRSACTGEGWGRVPVVADSRGSFNTASPAVDQAYMVGDTGPL